MLLKTKIPYFAALTIIGCYSCYLLNGFVIRDVLLTPLVCALALWKPNLICILEINDQYDLFAALPIYILAGLCIAIGLIISTHLLFINIGLFRMIQLIVLMSLMGPIIDISRYSK